MVRDTCLLSDLFPILPLLFSLSQGGVGWGLAGPANSTSQAPLPAGSHSDLATGHFSPMAIGRWGHWGRRGEVGVLQSRFTSHLWSVFGNVCISSVVSGPLGSGVTFVATMG